MSATTVAPDVAVSTKKRQRFIDSDVHEYPTSPAVLAEYLSPPFTDWVQYWSGPPHFGFVHPLWRKVGGATAPPPLGVTDPAIMQQEYFSKNDVQAAILTGMLYFSDMSRQPEFAAALASAYNDFIVEKWLSEEPRVRGSVQITPQDTEAAVREIDRVGSHPGMVQVLLPCSVHDYGDRRFLPIFEAADRHGLAIGMHVAQLIAQGLQHQYYVAWHAALPLSYQEQVLSLILHGVPDRFPELKFVVIEGGFTWVPALMWNLDQHYRSLRVEVPWVKRKPSDIMRSQFRFTTQPLQDIDASKMLQIIDWMESDQLLLFATDYPHWDQDEPTRALPSLPRDLRERIMLTNAGETYRL